MARPRKTPALNPKVTALELKVAQKLRDVRKRKGLTMKLASKIRRRYGVKINASYLSKMERGEVTIPLRTLFALLDYYKQPLAVFFSGLDESPGKSLRQIGRKVNATRRNLAEIGEYLNDITKGIEANSNPVEGRLSDQDVKRILAAEKKSIKPKKN